MPLNAPFRNWEDVVNAPHSAFFKGYTSDYNFDQRRNAYLMPSSESIFTHSNARILLGHASNGSLRMIAIPTQVFPAPTSMDEFGLGPGMYYHFDVAMYAGNLSYQISLDGNEQPIELSAKNLNNETYYADHFLPVTRAKVGEDLDITLISLAPVAPDAKSAALTPAPLPGPAGALYLMHVNNHSSKKVVGKITLKAGDMLVGNYEDAEPELSEINKPSISLRQQTLILSRPEGSIGIHLHNGKWNKMVAPFQSERPFSLDPGEDIVFETYVGIGKSYDDVMPIIYDLYRRESLEWVNLTTAFWRSRIGQLEVEGLGENDEAQMSRDVYIRCLLDNFNCLQTDADGNLISHWQGAPSHGYGTIWGIDVEPTAVSVVHLCPELARQTMMFFMTRSRAPRGPIDHSVPILVAPVIIARQWLQVTSDIAFLKSHPEIIQSLQGIIDDLLAMKSPNEALFPSRFSSDGPVGRRYDYGTNAKVVYTFDSMAYILRLLDKNAQADVYTQVAQEIREAITRTMLVNGPFGKQISGGTNLGEDAANFYSPEDLNYYDGEDTSSMLAPIYGACGFDDEPWINYHRFARSLYCYNYDAEFDTLRWSPAEPGVIDGTALFSRLGGAVTKQEMLEAFDTLRDVGIDGPTGSVFWWPHGKEYKRSLTRCSQGQGAWAWQYLVQWLGITTDANEHSLVLAPRGLLSKVTWKDFKDGQNTFDIDWAEGNHGTVARIKNKNLTSWTIKVGFRQPGSGANSSLSWQVCTLEPGEETTVQSTMPLLAEVKSMDRSGVLKLEAERFGENGIIFKRFGAALLWGNWDLRKLWDMRLLPLALRFVVGNATEMDWLDVKVDLYSPEGWKAQARQPLDWPKPEHLSEGCVTLELGNLRSGDRKAAPFWIKGPEKYTLSRRWGETRPFHVPSQPGPGINLWIDEVPDEEGVAYKAVLRARAKDGQVIVRNLDIPVIFYPAKVL
jgi:hypothetical protein